jgi:hypothetical protein
MTTYTLTELVFTLTGPVRPVGATHVDDKRLENLRVLCELYEALTQELYMVAKQKDRQEMSIQTVANRAQQTLDFVKEEYLS